MNTLINIITFPIRLFYWLLWSADRASYFAQPEVLDEYNKPNNSLAKTFGILLGAVLRFIVQWTVFIVIFFVIVYNIWMAQS